MQTFSATAANRRLERLDLRAVRSRTYVVGSTALFIASSDEGEGREGGGRKREAGGGI
jgi:hypothetical protein